jgi:glutamyl-Q tRNA(Asp) synthetase
MTITRFAPSPTGKLHLGHAYAAKVAHDLAREQRGRFLVRFEDIDHTRVRPEFYQGILEDLRWLGLDWDEEPWKQRDRLAHYQAGLNHLKSLDALYPCYCTRREIETELANLSHAPHGPEGPLYPGTCRGLTTPPDDREPAWRLDFKKGADLVGPLTFHDQGHGKIAVDPGLLGDVILARKDIGTSYHLAVVIDDAAQNITHVTRGEDLLGSTHIHRVLQALLNLPEPTYLHHQLILDDSGERLAKRHDALAIATLRERGADPWNFLPSP